MSKKIVYFIETKNEISGVQTIIPDIMEKAHHIFDDEVYYINLSHDNSSEENFDIGGIEGEIVGENIGDKAAEAEIVGEDDAENNTEFAGEYEGDSKAEIVGDDMEDGAVEAEIASEEEAGSNAEFASEDNGENEAEIAGENETDKEDETKISDDAEADEETEISDSSTFDEENEDRYLKFIDIKNCDFSMFENATFIVPINYLFFLLPYIAEYKEAKICPYIYDSQCIASFYKQIRKPNIEEISEMLNGTKSCLFINKQNSSGWDYGLDQYGDCIIPAPIELYSAGDKEKKVFDPELISIGWIGDISKTALDCIMRICDDLYKLYGEDEEENKRDTPMFDFHIIGVGAVMGQINFRKYCPLIRFIFPGDLKEEKLVEYVYSNVDLAVGYKFNAVKGASCGVPTIIPAIDDDPVMAKRSYVYFGDANQYVFCWKKRELHSILGYTDYTLEEVIERLISDETRHEDMTRCYEYAFSIYSYEGNARRINKYTDESSLTVERILKNKSIAGVLQQLDDYRAAEEKNANATYYDYFNRNKNVD